VVVCLEQGADLHIAQLMPLPLTVSCFSKIQIGFHFLIPAHPDSPGKRAVKRVCVCVLQSTVASIVNVADRRWSNFSEFRTEFQREYSHFCNFWIHEFSDNALEDRSREASIPNVSSIRL